MLQRHGDPLYADKKRVGGTTPGTQARRGYVAVTVGAALNFPPPATSPTVEKSDAPHRAAFAAQGKRGNGRNRREWEHRRIVKAKRGEVVHHIDLVPTNNDPINLHVFRSAAAHARAHRSLERAAAQLLHVGLLEFDRETGLYRPTGFSAPARK